MMSNTPTNVMLAKLNAKVKKQVADQFELKIHDGYTVVYTPFEFGDGDHFVIHLNKDGEQMYYSDIGHTLMHLSFWIDDEIIEKKLMSDNVKDMLSFYQVEDRDGELVRQIKNEDEIGRALLDFTQMLTELIVMVK